MKNDVRKFVLGSRSPRRLELLGKVVPANEITVLPPRSIEEAGFDGINDWAGIQLRLQEIARAKCDDVLDQLGANVDFDGSASVQHVKVRTQGAHAPRSPGASLRSRWQCVVTADTVILGAADSGQYDVLGQPPERDDWANVVRRWFHEYYFGRVHIALTAICVATPNGERTERVVRSEVTFRRDGERWLDWYLATGEPRGKAGGYAIQEAGSLFVEKIEGSLSNIVGLPLVELLEVFDALKIDRSTGD